MFTAGSQVDNSGSVTGGAGGAGSTTTGGAGGIGLFLDGGMLVNSGTITGGAGGDAYRLGNVGGDGVILAGGAGLSNTGTIIGGTGGLSGNASPGAVYGSGGAGGTGVQAGAGTMLSNDGAIIGGAGGACSIQSYDQAAGFATGGTGVTLAAGTILYNSGSITGGSGGAGNVLGGTGGVGVYIDGGALVTAGSIAGGQGGAGAKHGGQGLAIQFGSLAGTLAVEHGATFSGRVVANAAVQDVLELTRNQASAIGGLGTEFTNFSSVVVDTGAIWSLTGGNILAGGASMDVFGSLAVTVSFNNAGSTTVESGGTLKMGAHGTAQFAQLALSGGVLEGSAAGSVVIGADPAAAIIGSITIEDGVTLAGYGTISGATVVDNGTLLATGGTLSITGAVAGPGNAVIADGAALTARAALNLNTVTFNGGGELTLAAPLDFTGTVDGFQAGDSIDLGKLNVSALSFAGGVLTLRHGTSVVAQLHFAGSFTTADFNLASDGHGGSVIGFVDTNAMTDFASAAMTADPAGPGEAFGGNIATAGLQDFNHLTMLEFSAAVGHWATCAI